METICLEWDGWYKYMTVAPSVIHHNKVEILLPPMMKQLRVAMHGLYPDSEEVIMEKAYFACRGKTRNGMKVFEHIDFYRG